METLLLADDEPSFRLLMTELLEVRGFRCLEAAGGEQALEILSREKVDFFLCDLIMGIPSGMETMSRARELRPDLPIVAVSGAVRFAREANSSVPLGADALVEKPFRIDDLMKVLDRLRPGTKED